MEEKIASEKLLPNNTAPYLKKLYYSSIILLKKVGQFNPVLNFPFCFFKIRFRIVRAGISSRTFELPLLGC